jgi:tryptophan-rich sensory protein
MAEAALKPGWWKIALAAVLIIEAIGSLSGWVSNSGYGNAWFDALQKPVFMPPGWLFGVVWPILYALLGVSVAMIIAEPPSDRRRLALILFAVQMVLNFAWSPLFFALHDIRLAKYVIFLMAIIAAGAAGQFFRLRRTAGLLMVPYLAWLILAATLNSTIEGLNPAAGASLFG